MTLERAADSRNQRREWVEKQNPGCRQPEGGEEDAMERRRMVAGGESNRCFFFFFKVH